MSPSWLVLWCRSRFPLLDSARVWWHNIHRHTQTHTLAFHHGENKLLFPFWIEIVCFCFLSWSLCHASCSVSPASAVYRHLRQFKVLLIGQFNAVPVMLKKIYLLIYLLIYFRDQCTSKRSTNRSQSAG